MHLEAKYRQIVLTVIRKYLPKAIIWIFGSRLSGKNLKPHSDLDLALDNQSPIDLAIMGQLREDFQNSNLPFCVDLCDWHRLDDSFRELIRAESSVLF